MNHKRHWPKGSLGVLWKGGKAPEAPDYEAQAVAQGKANLEAQREATMANRVDQYNPWGSTTWSRVPGEFDQTGYDAAMANYNSRPAQQTYRPAAAQPTDNSAGFKNLFGGKFLQNLIKNSPSVSGNRMPNRDDFMLGGPGQERWSQTTSLNPAEQAKLDAQRGIESNLMGTASGMADRVGDAYANPFSLDGAPEAGRAGFEVTEEYRNAIMSRLAPDLLRQRERQEAQLIAQGVGGNTNSESWDRAQQDLGRNETDASMQALLKGYDVSNTEFDKSNQARSNWINEQTMMRDRPMDELLNVLRGTTPVSNPNFGGFAQQGAAAPADLNGAAGAQYGAAMDKYNAKQAQSSQTMSTVGTLAGTAVMAIAI